MRDYAVTTKLLVKRAATNIAFEMHHQTQYLFEFKTAWYGAFCVAFLPCCCLAKPLDAKLRLNAFMVKAENLDFFKSWEATEGINPLLPCPTV